MPFRRVVLGVAVLLLSVSNGAQADLITLRSGNGTEGENDTVIKMLVGPANASFGVTFTEAAHFGPARAGAAAWIITPDGAWKAQLDSDNSSQWIGTRDVTGPGVWGDTGLFAMAFSIALSSISEATLDIDFLVDNDLGGALNEGIFINGSPVTGSSRRGASPTYFQTDQSFSSLDITNLVTPGTNWFYVYMVDHTGPSGLQFSAEIDVVPEPCSILLLGLGLLALILLRRRLVPQSR